MNQTAFTEISVHSAKANVVNAWTYTGPLISDGRQLYLNEVWEEGEASPIMPRAERGSIWFLLVSFYREFIWKYI